MYIQSIYTVLLLLVCCAFAAKQPPPVAPEGEGNAKQLRKIIGGDVDSWVNPHNMFEYDAGQPEDSEEDVISEDTGTVDAKPRSEEPLRNTHKVVDPLEGLDEAQARKLMMTTRERKECSDIRKDLNKCKKQLQELQMQEVLSLEEQQVGDEECNKREFIYLRRLALNIVFKAKYGSDKPIKAPVKLELLLHPADVSKLEKLSSKACTRSGELESLMSSIMATGTVVPEDNGPPPSLTLPAESLWSTFASKPSMFWILPSLGILGTILLSVLMSSS